MVNVINQRVYKRYTYRLASYRSPIRSTNIPRI